MATRSACCAMAPKSVSATSASIPLNSPIPRTAWSPSVPEAAAYNEELVDGRSLCLETDVSDRDRFGRLLRYAWLEDGTMVNELLVAAGMARVATFPPDVKYTESLLLPAQQAAAEAGRGLWGR
ncbi:MAG: thermonuclease family protein [Dehalococcoidia bacterium]|nr:thermonuclease family protein [Dehalococcoidia bacterium]